MTKHSAKDQAPELGYGFMTGLNYIVPVESIILGGEYAKISKIGHVKSIASSVIEENNQQNHLETKLALEIPIEASTMFKIGANTAISH